VAVEVAHKSTSRDERVQFVVSSSATDPSHDEDVLIEYLQGRLSGAARETLERRLAEDSEARRVVAAMAELSIFASTLPADSPQSEGEPEGERTHADRRGDQGVPAAGDVLAEKYRVVAELGRGAMGVVLEVEHLFLHERYALKLLRRGTSSDKQAVQRLVREARAAMRIDSPHVARVFDLGALPDGRLFLVMELLSGRDLRSILAETRALPLETAVSYLRQAALGVGAAHVAGVVHRDLKPANLFVARGADGQECLKVVDFGLSKAPDVHRRAADEAALTTSGSMIGSPMYMAPEQIRDPKSADARSDVWALGVVLYEMVTGSAPYSARTVAGVLAAIMVDPPRSLAEHRVPAALSRTIFDCLAKDPAERITSTDELLRRLERWQDDAPPADRGAAPRAASPARRWGIGAAVVVAGTAVAILSARARSEPEPAAARMLELPTAAIARAAAIVATPAGGATATATASAPPAEAPSASQPTSAARPRPSRVAPSSSASAAAAPSAEVVFGKETEQRR
jgi:serine/threonine-protein kinase